LRNREEYNDLDGTDWHRCGADARNVAKELMFKSDDKKWSDWTMSVSDEDGHEVYSFAMLDRS
jgi:hypothetical protein